MMVNILFFNIFFDNLAVNFLLFNKILILWVNSLYRPRHTVCTA